MNTSIFKTTCLSVTIPVLVAAVTSSCATVPVPGGLTAARAYMAVSGGSLAANLAPTYLDEAKQMLERANQQFASNGDDAVCRDYAYIAVNKFELADVMARAELERQALGLTAAPNGSLRSEDARSSTGESLASAR